MASPQLVTGKEKGGAYSVHVLVIRGRAESPGPVCFLGWLFHSAVADGRVAALLRAWLGLGAWGVALLGVRRGVV